MPFRATSSENINKNEIKIIFLTSMCWKILIIMLSRKENTKGYSLDKRKSIPGAIYDIKEQMETEEKCKWITKFMLTT